MPNQVGVIQVTKSADTAGSLGTVPIGATQAIIRCEDNACRWRADGTDPTNDSGVLLKSGDVLMLFGNDYNAFLNRFSFINDVDGANSRLEGAYLDGFDRA